MGAKICVSLDRVAIYWSAVTSAFIYVLAPNCGTIGAANRTEFTMEGPVDRRPVGSREPAGKASALAFYGQNTK